MELCRSCHFYHVDFFKPGHIGHVVPPKILAFMRAKEIVGPGKEPSRQLVARLQAEGAKPKDWPLGPDNTLICTTCHNPHQKGVFPPNSALAINAMQIQGRRVVSKIKVPQMCLRCHRL